MKEAMIMTKGAATQWSRRIYGMSPLLLAPSAGPNRTASEVRPTLLSPFPPGPDGYVCGLVLYLPPRRMARLQIWQLPAIPVKKFERCRMH